MQTAMRLLSLKRGTSSRLSSPNQTPISQKVERTGSRRGFFAFTSSAGETNLLRQEVEELRTRVELQAHELRQLKEELRREETEAEDWREKWNFQNFKLQLLIDMWVLREIELKAADDAAPSSGEHGSEHIVQDEVGQEAPMPLKNDSPAAKLPWREDPDILVESSIDEDEF